MALYKIQLKIEKWALTYTRNIIKCKNEIEITIDYSLRIVYEKAEQMIPTISRVSCTVSLRETV